MECQCLLTFQFKKGIPVEVIPMAYVPVMKKIEKLGLKPILRMARAKAVSTYRQINDFFVSMLLNDPQNGSSLILCLLISIWQQSFEVTYPPPTQKRGGGGIVCHSKEKLQSASVFGVTI